MQDRIVPQYAEFSRRLAAFLVDALLIMGVVSALVFIPGTLFVLFGKPKEPVLLSTSLVSIAVFFLYFSLMESSGQKATLGKRLLGMSVIDTSGGRIGLRRALVRTAGKSVPFLFFAISSEVISCVVPFFENAGMLMLIPILLVVLWYLTIWFNPKKQATHDIMAGSLVVTVS